jgi:transposase
VDLEKENETLRAEVLRQREQIELLEQRLDYVLRQLHSAKSEKFDPNQLTLLDDESKKAVPSSEISGPEEGNANDAAKSKSTTGKAKPKPRIKGLDRLEIEEVIHEPLEVQASPEDFERYDEEVTDRLEIIPRKLFIKRHVRPKYRNIKDRSKAPLVAPAPSGVLVGGLPAASLIAHLIVGKYCDHLPIYRQEKIFKRSGVTIPRDLLLKWLHKGINGLIPIAAAIRVETLGSAYLQVDETPIRYLEPGVGKAPRGYLWLANDPHGSLYYHWGIGRGQEALIETIGTNYTGILQCDGWSAYESYEGDHPEIIFMSCLAHIRRRFYDYYELVKKQKGESKALRQCWFILNLMRQLYRIEAELRKAKAGPRLRQAVRSSQSRPIVARLTKVFNLLIKNHRPSHPFGQALSYALGQWGRFQTYLEQGLVEIDNNLIENAVRPTKLGMKNWLFFGSKDAGHQAAAIYTIVENCHRYGVPVEDYLREVLELLPTLKGAEEKAADLTPAKIAAARRGDPRRNKVNQEAGAA